MPSKDIRSLTPEQRAESERASAEKAKHKKEQLLKQIAKAKEERKLIDDFEASWNEKNRKKKCKRDPPPNRTSSMACYHEPPKNVNNSLGWQYMQPPPPAEWPELRNEKTKTSALAEDTLNSPFPTYTRVLDRCRADPPRARAVPLK